MTDAHDHDDELKPKALIEPVQRFLFIVALCSGLAGAVLGVLLFVGGLASGRVNDSAFSLFLLGVITVLATFIWDQKR